MKFIRPDYWRLLWRLDELKEGVLRRLQPSRMNIPYTWPLMPERCPCDLHFCDYLAERGIRKKAIFHFGTGLHHLVGIRNREAGWKNDILAITGSPREHARYVHRAVRDPSFAEHYKVLFGDIYRLQFSLLPRFDLVTLFHLHEFTPAAGAEGLLGDAGVLASFLTGLAPGGRLLFYAGSEGFPKTQELLRDKVQRRALAPEEEYKSLVVYRSGANEGDQRS
jgi:hypothetical protein